MKARSPFIATNHPQVSAQFSPLRHKHVETLRRESWNPNAHQHQKNTVLDTEVGSKEPLIILTFHLQQTSFQQVSFTWSVILRNLLNNRGSLENSGSSKDDKPHYPSCRRSITFYGYLEYIPSAYK